MGEVEERSSFNKVVVVTFVVQASLLLLRLFNVGFASQIRFSISFSVLGLAIIAALVVVWESDKKETRNFFVFVILGEIGGILQAEDLIYFLLFFVPFVMALLFVSINDFPNKTQIWGSYNQNENSNHL
ncbi:MAG: hypothetical protein ACW99G_14395 [Candidatus Thorarchaeota archaeon]|jgi:hypothetical protein